MSSNNETRRVQRKKPDQRSDLSNQYRKIGIKAVAAATHHKVKESADASGDRERRKRAQEKANG